MPESTQMFVLISVDLDTKGKPKGPIQGNQLCWFGNLEYVTKDLEDPTKKLLQHYIKRERKFGIKNISDKLAQKCLKDWCAEVGVKTKVSVNNMWARPTFVNMGIHELQLPDQQVMNVTGHKCATQMRQDYCKEIN